MKAALSRMSCGLALAACFAVPAAHAASASYQDATFSVGSGSFENDFKFSIASAAELGVSATLGSGISGLNVLLNGKSLTDYLPSAQYFASFASLKSGSYTLSFLGSAGSNGGTFSTSYGLTSAVPEPATALMALVAVGLLGAGVARRRSR